MRGRKKIFNFSGTQLDVIKYHGLELCYVGPCGTGKSWAVLAKIYLSARKYPNTRYLIVRDVRAALTQSTLVTLERNVMTKNELAKYSGGKKNNRSSYIFENGSEIVFGGMTEPERILSTEYDIIMVEEAIQGITKDDYETLKSRLRNFKLPYQQIILVCNPSSPYHWIKQEIDKGSIYCINAQHTDNPKFWNAKTKEWTQIGETYLKTLQGFSAIKRKRLFEGQWTEAEGIIFTEWSENNIVKSIEDIEFNSIYGVVDFGYTDAGVAIKVGRTKEDKLYITEVECRTKMDINWWSNKIKRMQGLDSIIWICDSASPGSIETLKQAGINAIPTKKGPGSKLKNISMIKTRLLNDKLFYYRNANLNPDPNLFKEKKPWNLPMEMALYSWKTKNGQAEDIPEDGDDHHIDALGYLINHLDNKPAEVPFAFAM